MTPRAVYEARNRLIAQLHVHHNWSISELAGQFGMCNGNVHRILKAKGATLPAGEKVKRSTEAARKKAADPEFRAKMSASIAAYWQLPRGSGRPKLFEDQPEKRAEYLFLQRKVGAVMARKMVAA